MGQSRTRRTTWEEAVATAQLVVVGPAPPLRGGIAAHTLRLVEHVNDRGGSATVASYRRLYPSFLFPGRSQRTGGRCPDWSEEVLDVCSPPTWARLGRLLAASRATVLLQWWHPVVAPALALAIRGVDRQRLVGLCHNLTPHEAFPAAALAARAVLGRCGRVVCHSEAEAEKTRRLLGATSPPVDHVPLPMLIRPPAGRRIPGQQGAEAAAAGRAPWDGLSPAGLALPDGARVVVAAGHLRAYKGIDVLVEAWGLARLPPQARLLLVGESYLRGRAQRRLRDSLRRDPSIVAIDQYVEDEDLVGFLDAAEVLVAAHVAASQSGLLPIARGLGLPCIVSDAGGLPEQLGGLGGAAPLEGAQPGQGPEPGPGERVVRAGDSRDLAAALEEHFSRSAAWHREKRWRMREGRRDSFFEDWDRVVEAIGIAARP